MTQVTDEMFGAARQKWLELMSDYNRLDDCIRAALEAALAVRETNNDDLTDDQIAYCHERANSRRAEWRNDLVARLRRTASAYATSINGGIGSKVGDYLEGQAAELIERQAEEIAWLRGKQNEWTAALVDNYKRLTAERTKLIEENTRHKEVICMLTAERAELIEALRPMAVDVGDPNWDDMGLAELELTVGDCRRACALLERQAEKIAEWRQCAKVEAGERRRLTAERAELIEALKIFDYSAPYKGCSDDHIAYVRVGELRRVSAILERIGAKEVG